MNYVENINFAQTSVLAAGLYYPRHAALLGLAYIIGRYFLPYLDSFTQLDTNPKKEPTAKLDFSECY